jgi:thiol-disulfide isomerase/thioredoxin
MVPLSAYRGKVVFLNFWATWCKTCRIEMPSMDKLQRLLGTTDFVILAVASDENWQKIHDYFPKGTSMSVLLDPPDKPGNTAGIAESWGTTQLPETYLIDRDGNIRYYFVNTRDWADPKAINCVRAMIAE